MNCWLCHFTVTLPTELSIWHLVKNQISNSAWHYLRPSYTVIATYTVIGGCLLESVWTDLVKSASRINPLTWVNFKEFGSCRLQNTISLEPTFTDTFTMIITGLSCNWAVCLECIIMWYMIRKLTAIKILVFCHIDHIKNEEMCKSNETVMI